MHVEQFCDSIQYGRHALIYAKVQNTVIKIQTTIYVDDGFSADLKPRSMILGTTIAQHL